MIAALPAPPAVSVSAAPVTVASTVAPIIVTAPSSPAKVPDLVRRFALEEPRQPLARWKVTLCPAVTGLIQSQADLIRTNLIRLAENLNIQVGSPGCDPNLVIVATNDMDNTLAAIIKGGAHTLGPTAMREQYSTQRMAFALSDDKPYHKFAMTSNFGVMDGPFGRTDRSFTSAVIVFDAKKFQGVSLEQFSDYVSLVSLADVANGGGALGVDTILNLYAPLTPKIDRPAGLTMWDREYLAALYKAPAQESPGMLIGAIAERISRPKAYNVLLPQLADGRPLQPALRRP